MTIPDLIDKLLEATLGTEVVIRTETGDHEVGEVYETDNITIIELGQRIPWKVCPPNG